jgi:hypothetical protein
MKTWKRPPEFKPGWTWGPHIVVPRVPHTDHAKIDEMPTKHVEWMPKPAEGRRVTIAVIFASPEKTL